MPPTRHEDHKDIKCESCGKIFESKKAMVTHHNQKHWDKKPGKVAFSCENCSKTFVKSKYRARHFKKCNLIKK